MLNLLNLALTAFFKFYQCPLLETVLSTLACLKISLQENKSHRNTANNDEKKIPIITKDNPSNYQTFQDKGNFKVFRNTGKRKCEDCNSYNLSDIINHYEKNILKWKWNMNHRPNTPRTPMSQT